MKADKDYEFIAEFKKKESVKSKFIWFDGMSTVVHGQSDNIEASKPHPQDYSVLNRLYTFDSWTKETTLNSDADFVWTASYKMVPGYYVDFDLANGSGSMERIFVRQNEAATILSYSGTRAEYVFDGWSDGTKTYADGGTIPASTLNDCAPIKLTAIWTGSKYDLTVNYHGPIEDGVFEKQESVHTSLSPGQTYSIASPVIAHYKPSIELVEGSMPSHDVTVDVFYDSDLYTITYVGGDSKSLRTVYSYTMEYVLEAAPTYGGAFDGWYSDSEFTHKVEKISKYSTGEKKFYMKVDNTDYIMDYLHLNVRSPVKGITS